MSVLAKQTTLIPCEPFETEVYDLTIDKFERVRVIGYHVAIRDLSTFQTPGLLTPINLGKSNSKHGIIAVPAYEPICEPVEVNQ